MNFIANIYKQVVSASTIAQIVQNYAVIHLKFTAAIIVPLQIK